MAIIPQIAASGLFDILDELYISDISELPFSSGTPTVNWQQSGNIRGYVDIVGFRNLSRDGENYFILGGPASLAIVAGDATGSPPGIFDSLDKSFSLTQSGKNLIASLNVVLKWHTIACDDKGCFVNGRFTDTAAFQDIEVIPNQFDNAISPRVDITEYNNTIEPGVNPNNTYQVNSRGYQSGEVMENVTDYTDEITTLNLEDIWKHTPAKAKEC